MKTVTRLIYTALLIAGAFSTSTAMACTTGLWLGGTEGSPVAGSPAAISRVSGLCAMELTAAGSVKDISPSAETAANIRFYVYAQELSAEVVILEAFTATDDSLLTVSFDGSNFVFASGSNTSDPIAGTTGWNLVELAWASEDAMDFWVNTDATVDGSQGSVATVAGAMDSVILGNRTTDTYTGSLTFDDYEAHRTTKVGPLLMMGDANNDAAINILDIGVITSEILVKGLGEGKPDCNLDGSVNILDIGCTTTIILSAP